MWNMALSEVDFRAVETQRKAWAQERLRVAFVPTMGSLHEGHRSLIREAKSLCDRVIVSIFVNPTQFAEGEDLADYPRDAEGDLTKAASAGADLVWFAQHEVIYPPDWGTTLVPQRVGLGLETDHRPHFFTGVATVVARLLCLVRPEVAFFGEKDYQQLLVVRQLNRDLHLGVDVRAGKLIRADDGLALSSRNAYLSAAQRARALAVPEALRSICAAYAAGERSVDHLEDLGAAELKRAGLSVDYCAVVSSEDLSAPGSRVDDAPKRWRALVAARCEGLRLLDNCSLDDPPWR